ncbi:tyrosyl-DNA phosphodiesterase-domain-containing protein, partial [Mycena haematopus]
TQSFEPIVVDDSETEDALVTSSASSVSIGKRKEAESTVSSTIQNFGLHSLPDRAQMEAERLARRKRTLQDETTGDSKRQRVSQAGATLSSTTNTPIASRIFHDGIFFPTKTLHANPRADGREAIQLQDILGPANYDLRLAIVSSFGLDEEWLALHFSPDVPVIVVAKDPEHSGPSMARLFKNTNWIQTCPRVNTGGCFHMKYMLLVYKSGRLRVVISTANLVPVDWAYLENMVFIQDVVLRSSSGSTESKPEEGFAMLLETVLKATNVGPALESVKQKTPELPLKSISDLSKLWDWSSVKAELVPSLAGKYEGWNKIKMTGHPRLMRALETLGLATGNKQKLVVECQGSSIGTYTTQWFNQFYISASGHFSALKAHMNLSEAKRKKLEYPPGVKVVFPTSATVKSTSGYRADKTKNQSGSDSLFCTRNKWEAKSFPRSAFHDSKSSAGKVLMHTKVIHGTLLVCCKLSVWQMIIGSFTQKNKAIPEATSAAGWMYIGSHNFTSPAWGNLSGSADAPVLNVNNYELGIIVPLMTPEDLNTASAWERPPLKYAASDSPWVCAFSIEPRHHLSLSDPGRKSLTKNALKSFLHLFLSFCTVQFR